MSDDLKIMVVDDEPIILDSISDYLDDYPLEVFADPRQALLALDRDHYDIIISDYRMPGLSGLDLFLEGKRKKAYFIGILLTAYAEKQLLLDFINRDLIRKVLEKPLNLVLLRETLDEMIHECISRNNINQELETLKYWCCNMESVSANSFKKVIGFNGNLRHIFKDLPAIAETEENVLITGETGTGKELIARIIHRRSPRCLGPFISINCGALPDNLVESELFGHAKGSFTGAYIDKPGKIELAHSGTLFLDEIGELRPDLQVKLLHVVQKKEVERIGENITRKIDFRLLTATHRDLPACTSSGTFREDLYYRISTIPVHLPPLRERDQDLEELSSSLLEKFSAELGRKPVVLSPEALYQLKYYSWPGNIRELENVLKRAIILLDRDAAEIPAGTFSYLFSVHNEKTIRPDQALEALGREVLTGQMGIREIEKGILNKILHWYDGNIKEAVKDTGISKDRFYRNRF